MSGISTPGDQRLLAVFAHPDDEMGVGGTLAMCSARGVRVHLVTATRGEVGMISDPSLATPETLGQVREQELREACRIQGIEEPIFLDYRDSGMKGTPDNDHPDSLNQADPGQAVSKLVDLMKELRPKVVVTFDATSFYGHPDHVKVHHLTTEAFHQLARGRKNAARLYYAIMPKKAFRRMAEQMQATGAAMPSDFPPIDQMGTPDENVTTAIDVSRYWETKRKAMAAHRTQFGPENPLLSMPEEALASFFSTEYFQRVFPAFKDAQQEKALF